MNAQDADTKPAVTKPAAKKSKKEQQQEKEEYLKIVDEVVPNDVYDDKIKLYMGDCIEKMRLLEPDSIDLILCDLPYGTTKCKWDTIISMDALWEQYKRVIKKPHGVILLFGQQPFTSMLISSNYDWYKYNLIWKKNKTTQFLLT